MIFNSKSRYIYLNEKLSTTGIFFTAVILLLVYLMSIKYHIYLPVHIFWVSISLIFGSIVYQIIKIKLSTYFIKVVLFEIAIVGFVFHLIYLIPYYGLRGSDEYFDFNSMKSILLSGFVRGVPQYINTTSYWPMIHIIGAQLKLITNLNAFDVVKWFPPLMSIALTLMLYLLIRNIFGDERVALLSILLFNSLQHYIIFGSAFVRETIAIVYIVGFVYIYFSANSPIKIALSIIFLISLTLSHHLTSLIIFIFLSIHFISSKVLLSSTFSNLHSKTNFSGKKITPVIFLLAIMIPLAYWMYVYIQPLVTIVTFFKGMTSSTDTSTYAQISNISLSTIQTIRGYIIYLGFYFFNLIFSAILLYQLFHNAKKQQLEIYSFSIFLLILGAFGFLILYIIPIKTVFLFPDRLLAYGWIFGFAPLTLCILTREHKWFKRTGILLLVAFLLYNIYVIEPTAWDLNAEGVAMATSEEDYALANTLNFHGDIKIGAHQNSLMAIYDIHNYVGINIFTMTDLDIQDYDWIIVQKKQLELQNKYIPNNMSYKLDEIEQHPSMNVIKIYESNSLAAYKMKI